MLRRTALLVPVLALRLASTGWAAAAPASPSSEPLLGFSTGRAKEGLPRRPWFTHQMYVPGFYTGYGVKTLPGVREAIEERHWKEAEEQIGFAASTIEGFAREIDRATAVLGTR